MIPFAYSPPLVIADSADFDGSTMFMARGAGLSGAVDGKSGIMSFWFRIDGGDGTIRGILNNVTTLAGGTGRMNAVLLITNTLKVFGVNTSSTVIMSVESTNALTTGATWHHLLASWDLAAATVQLYIDDVNVATNIVATNDNIDYTLADAGCAALPDSTAKYNGCLAEVYYAPNQFLDFSNTLNRRKFISATLKPVHLGLSGELPTGTSAIVHFHLDDGETASHFGTNRGTGGNFTVTGALATGSTSPSD